MRSHLRFSLLVLLVLIVSDSLSPAGLAAEVKPNFERDIARLIATRCAACHNESEKKGGLDLTQKASAFEGGESGRVIEPGQPDDSLLWQYIDAGEMPPKKPLAAEERARFRSWIEHGAEWIGGDIDPLQYTSESRAGYDWWSLQPLNPPAAPALVDARHHNAIDSFIESRLGQAKLSMSPPADRRTLIRRLYFDLLGLLPTQDEIADFFADDRPLAYESMVERLLASPHYGERWARHWLDVIRYGESQGFERDKLRPNAWRYRDWVIQALNGDMPYQEFAARQLAGDVLYPHDASAIVGTGFLVAGPYDEVGQLQQSEAMKAVVREDELEDILGTVSQTFLGLTVNCARCHDHKFDPIRQREYYQLTAALAGVWHGERSIPGEGSADDSSMLADLKSRLRLLEQRLDAIEGPIREQLAAQRRHELLAVQPPAAVAAWDFDRDASDSVSGLDLELKNGARIEDGKLILEEKGYAVSPAIRGDIGSKTLEVWLSLKDLKQQGGGALTIETTDGGLFDSIVFAEKDPQQWLAGSNSYERTESFNGNAETEADENIVQVAISYHPDGTIVGYRNGIRYGKEYRSKGLATYRAGEAHVVLGLRHSPPGGNRFLRCKIERARLYDRALNDQEIAAAAGELRLLVSDQDITSRLSSADLSIRGHLVFELDQIRQRIGRLTDAKTYAVTPKTPNAVHVLLRGNPAQKGDLVSPGGIQSIQGPDSSFGLESDSSDAERRIRLTRWIINERNPLFARVIVNRLWHYHFGVGLVDTPNDLGFNGGRPSHPELLDWLAGELIRSQWSLKHVQRLIVNSATYRQSSQLRAEAMAVDAGNRLLWRKSPQRLEAEAIRDIILRLTDQLDPTMGGPGYHDFATFVSNSQFYEMRDPVGASFQRRSIYRTWLRSGRSPFLDVFDCPDPSTKTPQRAVTTTPLQALALLNNSFVLRLSQQLAEQIEAEVGNAHSSQVRQAFGRLLGRTADDAEVRDCEAFVREHGLAALCRVLLNSNEFLYVD